MNQERATSRWDLCLRLCPENVFDVLPPSQALPSPQAQRQTKTDTHACAAYVSLVSAELRDVEERVAVNEEILRLFDANALVPAKQSA